MTVKLKRAYSPAAPRDGKRYLVDRLWPRGVRKDALKLDAWLKNLAPSTELRRWFNHDPQRWDEFQVRYRAELEAPERQALLQDLAKESRAGTVTLVFAAKDEVRNEAAVLSDVIAAMASPRRRA
jgi:uncharacterized protein YeaO (DUF488 family)